MTTVCLALSSPLLNRRTYYFHLGNDSLLAIHKIGSDSQQIMTSPIEQDAKCRCAASTVHNRANQ